MGPSRDGQPHVVIVGGGFGGLSAAKALAGAAVRVALVDRQNDHLVQPMVYQVAMAGLSPADIAYPIRSILRRRPEVRVVLDEVKSIDVESHRVVLRASELSYDFLIVATGTQTNYFAHPEWSQSAVGLKNID